MTMISLKDKYSVYYSASGNYRKYLMKQESANAAEMYDYFSRLSIRCNKLVRCEELIASHRTDITEMAIKIQEFVRDMHGALDMIFSFDGDKLHTRFAELYDEAASIVEGFEDRAIAFLGSKNNLSEDAQSIQRRNHFTKNHAKSSSQALSAKMSWKRDKAKHVDSIQKFHRSSAGKQFHRNLSRYNQRKVEDMQFTRDDIMMTAKGVSSLITHALIEIQNVSTSAVEQSNADALGHANNMREIVHLFKEIMSVLVDAYFNKDHEAVADVLEVVRDYYAVAGGAGDEQHPDTAGVEVES